MNNPNDYEYTVSTPGAQSQQSAPIRFVKSTVRTGVGFGSCLAMVISYTNWHSIFWAIVQGLLGWIYVVYYIIVHGGAMRG